MPDTERLVNRWVHAHEEDAGGKSVYRSGGYEPPPARGRTAMLFHADGTGIVTGPGPTDRTAHETFTWKLVGNELQISSNQGERRFLVETLDEDRMILAPV